MNSLIKIPFFFFNEKIERLNSILSSKNIQFLIAPLLPLIAVLTSTNQLSNNWWLLHMLIILTGGLMFFMLTVASVYFLKNDNIFKLYKREKSNKNLDHIRSSKNNITQKIEQSLKDNEELITNYYHEFRKIELFNDDVSINDFTTLLYDCMKQKGSNKVFRLEVSAGETHSFINEFIIPFLAKINNDIRVSKNNIALLFQYKKGTGYKAVNTTSLSNLERARYNNEQKKIYSTLK